MRRTARPRGARRRASRRGCRCARDRGRRRRRSRAHTRRRLPAGTRRDSPRARHPAPDGRQSCAWRSAIRRSGSRSCRAEGRTSTRHARRAESRDRCRWRTPRTPGSRRRPSSGGPSGDRASRRPAQCPRPRHPPTPRASATRPTRTGRPTRPTAPALRHDADSARSSAAAAASGPKSRHAAPRYAGWPNGPPARELANSRPSGECPSTSAALQAPRTTAPSDDARSTTRVANAPRACVAREEQGGKRDPREETEAAIGSTDPRVQWVGGRDRRGQQHADQRNPHSGHQPRHGDGAQHERDEHEPGRHGDNGPTERPGRHEATRIDGHHRPKEERGDRPRQAGGARPVRRCRGNRFDRREVEIGDHRQVPSVGDRKGATRDTRPRPPQGSRCSRERRAEGATGRGRTSRWSPRRGRAWCSPA